MPGIIYLGGIPFVASGVFKEVVQISVLLITIPFILRKLSSKFITIPLILYVLITIISGIRVFSLFEAISCLRMALIGLIYYLVGPYISGDNVFKNLARMLIILGILDSFLGLYRYFFDPDFLILSPEIIPEYYVGFQSGVYRLSGIFGINATSVMSTLAIFSVLLYRKEIPALKATWLPLIGLFIFTIALTQSRTGFIVFCLSILLWAQIEKKLFKRFSTVFKVIRRIGIAIILAVIAVPSETKAIVFGRILDLALRSDSGRGNTWPALLAKLSWFDFIFGRGLNALGGMGAMMKSGTALQITADNLVLHFLVTIGLIGVISFVAFVFVIYQRGFITIKLITSNSPVQFQEKKRSLMFALGLITLCLTASLAGVTIMEPFFGAIFWLSAGFISYSFVARREMIPCK